MSVEEGEPCKFDVIFDRAPVDYLAYSQFTADCGTTDIDDEFVATMVPAVRESLGHIDILAFVRGSERWLVEMEADGIRPVDLEYRDAVSPSTGKESLSMPLPRDDLQ